MIKHIISALQPRYGIILMVSANMLSACSVTPETKVAEQFSPVPIQEIREELQVPIAYATEALYMVLSQNNLEIRNGLQPDGSFETSSIRIRDTICKGKYLQNAPVSCQLSFTGSLQEKGPNISSLNLRYKEYCLEQRHIPVVCKDSNAERLLFSIHKEIREETGQK